MNDLLAKTIGGPLREKLLNAKLYDEAQRFNIPHVTVLHIHNPDPTTPEKMLKGLPKLPGELKLVLKNFYTTEAAKGAGHHGGCRSWHRQGGPGLRRDDGLQYSCRATADGASGRPTPTCYGPIYAVMGDAAKELVRTVGVSGLNTVKDGTTADAAQPTQHAGVLNGKVHAGDTGGVRPDRQGVQSDLPEGIPTTFKTVSIVELGFAGPVLREIYRIDLKNGSVLDVRDG